MSELKYECMRCGNCCYEVPNEFKKRIPLYPEEVDSLIEISKEMNIDFKVIEDLVFPDQLNEKILVLTYKIKMDKEKHCCPFYSEKIGCLIQENKPMACKSYPLSIKQEDAFNFQISIDPLCQFILKHYDKLKNIDWEQVKKIFEKEYKNAEFHLNKNKKLILKIKKLEYLNKIKISRNLSLDQFNYYLKNWEREEIRI